jgi:catechol 2,3-dioxygenase-like lactoylglutathione lyase family enzyme
MKPFIRVLISVVGIWVPLGLSAQSATDPLELTLHHATASVSDLNRAVKWYQEKLGFKMVLRRKLDENSEIAWMTMPGNRVDLIQRNGSSKGPASKDHLTTQGWAHIVFSVADADRAYAILKARGVNLPEPVSTNATLHIKTSHFPDSEGNWLEIYQDMSSQPKK